jgi:hypothetical protein
MSFLKKLTQHVFGRIERRYWNSHNLVAIGEVLLVGRRQYRGPVLALTDGTVLKPGDIMGELHFNNARLRQLHLNSRSSNPARVFGRLMLTSLHQLAAAVRERPEFADLHIYHGLSWLRPHGTGVGFITDRLPAGIERSCRIIWFRLLIWAFAGDTTGRQRILDPHHYWLSRQSLLQTFPACDTKTNPAQRRRHRVEVVSTETGSVSDKSC